jgi:hypothetical protein
MLEINALGFRIIPTDGINYVNNYIYLNSFFNIMMKNRWGKAI